MSRTLEKLQSTPAPTFSHVPRFDSAQARRIESLRHTPDNDVTIAIVAGNVRSVCDVDCARCGHGTTTIGNVTPTGDRKPDTPTYDPIADECGAAIDGPTPDTDDNGDVRVYCADCQIALTLYVDVSDEDIGCIPIRAFVDDDGDTLIDVPAWIDQDIDADTIASIAEGGCNSGAYMAASWYSEAAKTMNEHGDDVLEYLSDCDASVKFDPSADSWTGFASKVLVHAVDLWAFYANDKIDDARRAGSFSVRRNA